MNMLQFIKNSTGIELNSKQVEQLNEYSRILAQENEKYNLTAITEPSEVWEKHFADSILGSVAIKQGASVADIGAGAGFPSLPLAIARTDISVTLVDSLEKRVNFCKEVCRAVGIEASFFHERAEDFAKTHRETYDVATARAVAPLNILLEYTAQIVKIGGIVLAYKTDASEAEIAENACHALGLRAEKFIDFTLPSGAKRCLMMFKKVKQTPSKYPRGQNKPRKNPL